MPFPWVMSTNFAYMFYHCHSCRNLRLVSPSQSFGAGIIFLILAHSVYEMWIIQEPNKLELWNKLHFKEKKKRRVYTMFKIFGTYICWLNI